MRISEKELWLAVLCLRNQFLEMVPGTMSPQTKLATSDSQAAPKVYLGGHLFGSLCTFSVPAHETHITPANAQHVEPNSS